MLTIMCPNCRLRFPAPGCCATGGDHGIVRDPATAPAAAAAAAAAATTTTTTSIASGGGGCGSATVSLDHLSASAPGDGVGGLLLVDASGPMNGQRRQQVTISTQCGIQSGGCLIQSSNAEVLLSSSSFAPRLEVRSKLTGGGCFVEKRIEDLHQQNGGEPPQDQYRPLLISEEQLRTSFEQAAQFHRSHSTTARLDPPPSGCQELPGTRRESSAIKDRHKHQHRQQQQQHQPSTCECRCCCYCHCCSSYSKKRSTSPLAECGPQCGRNHCQVATSNGTTDRHGPAARCCASGTDCAEEEEEEEDAAEERAGARSANVDASLRAGDLEGSKYSGDVRIHVNATVHLPSTNSTTMGSCTFNITASTSSTTDCTPGSNNCPRPSNGGGPRLRNNFNGGGIVSPDSGSGAVGSGTGGVDGREETPGTPVSWLTPCPWGFDVGYMSDKDVVKLNEVRRLLQTCGWYHEGLSWQQSENLLKNAPVGRWLMRDSSDSRYTFAISVQTARGPTSVRVFYFMGKFRLDAEPRLALAMPLFDCPIKMLEYYCEYSKRMDEHRREVWVDYSGQVYSQIYLSEPLLKEVRSLSHLARIAVNRGSGRLDKERERLPPVIKNYLNEYPYTL